MARLARLAVAGEMHYVVQRGHNGGAVFGDEADRHAFIDALREATREHRCEVAAYALGTNEIHLLLRPADDAALSRTMQSLGRRYAARFNRRHGRSGALWDGRFRAAVVEPGEPTLTALRVIDTGEALLAARADGGGDAAARQQAAQIAQATSAAHRTGGARDPLVTDPPEFWRLGNTPFEREARYRELCAEPVPTAVREALRHAAFHAWAHGSPAYVSELAQRVARPLRPRARGRPRKATAVAGAAGR